MQLLPSLLTACLFAGSGICGQRASVRFGALSANALRLAFAAIILGALAHWQGPVDFTTRSAHRLLVSGALGFGAGDVALFLAYPRLGARITLLINLCTAPLFGALGDWLLLGALITAQQALACLVILVGVVMALREGVSAPGHERVAFLPGILAAVMAGFGQGTGAALSRYAQAAARVDGVSMDGIREAFIRVLPGLAFAVLVFGIGRAVAANGTALTTPSAPGLPRWRWLIGAVFFGPVLGVSCFQWALSSATSAVVLSVVSTTPILILPLSMVIEKDSPSWSAVIGAFVAVGGVAILTHHA